VGPRIIIIFFFFEGLPLPSDCFVMAKFYRERERERKRERESLATKWKLTLPELQRLSLAL
jgi:hypothetical protein